MLKGPDEHQNEPRHYLHLSARKNKKQGENQIAIITINRNKLKKNLMTQSTKVLPFKQFQGQGILSLKEDKLFPTKLFLYINFSNDCN